MLTKPLDPITAGEELAKYCRQRRDQIKGMLTICRDDQVALSEVYELTWERDFWRAKALGTELPFNKEL